MIFKRDQTVLNEVFELISCNNKIFFLDNDETASDEGEALVEKLFPTFWSRNLSQKVDYDLSDLLFWTDSLLIVFYQFCLRSWGGL